MLVSLGEEQPPATAAGPDYVAEVEAASSPAKRRKLAVSLFLTVLCDADRDLRQAAAEALGRLGERRAESALVKAQADSDAGVRFAAERALRELNSAPAS